MSPKFSDPLKASDLLMHSALIPRVISKTLVAALQDEIKEPFNAVKVVCNLRGSTIVALYPRPDTDALVVRVKVEQEDLPLVEAVFWRKPVTQVSNAPLTPPKVGRVTTCDLMAEVRKILHAPATDGGEGSLSAELAGQFKIRQGGFFAACSILVRDYKESLAFWEEIKTYLNTANNTERAITEVFVGIGAQLQAACATKGGGFFLNRIKQHLPDLTQYYGVDFGAVEIPSEFTKGLLDAFNAGLRREVLEVLDRFDDPVLQARIVLRCLAEALKSNRWQLLKDFKKAVEHLFGGYDEPHEIPDAARAAICFECTEEHHGLFDRFFATLPLSILKSPAVAWSFGYRIGQELVESGDGETPIYCEDYITLIDRYLAGRMADRELDRDEIAPKIAAGIIFGSRGLTAADTLTLLKTLEGYTTGGSESKRAFWSLRVLYSLGFQYRSEKFRNAEVTFFGSEILEKAQADAVSRGCDGEAYFYELSLAADSWLVVADPTLSDHIKSATVDTLQSVVPSNGLPKARLELAERFYRAGQPDRAFAILPDFDALPENHSANEMVAIWNLRKLAFDTHQSCDELQETLDRRSLIGGWVHSILSGSRSQCDNQLFFSHVEEAAAHGLWKEVLRLLDGAESIVDASPVETTNAVFQGLLRFRSSRGPLR
jgi:hypothetical protein